MKKANVLIVDDMRMVNEGLGSLLEDEENLHIAGNLMDGSSCLKYLQDHPVDLILLDHQMPQMDGLTTLKNIRSKQYPVKVILLTLLSEEVLLKKYMEIGIEGCLLKQDSPEELIFGVQQVLKGESFFSSAVTKVLLEQANRRATLLAGKNTHIKDLTPAEWEVLSLIGKGLSANEIASKRNTSILTVNKQKQSIMNKLDIHKETKLMHFALQFGIH